MEESFEHRLLKIQEPVTELETRANLPTEYMYYYQRFLMATYSCL